MAVVPSWIEAHCVVPDGFRRGEPFRLYDYQLLYLAHFYEVRGDAPWVPANPIRAPAFVYRRGLLIGPQKVGKNPLIATQVCAEGVGPVLFAGWAGIDDGYACADHGCRCGWEYAYDPGEPMGMAWPTPLIQITAFSEDSTENTYDALRPMIELGPLADLIPKTGESFIRLPGGGRIDTVTASDQSRLGQRVTFVPQDELGLWNAQNRMTKVADTQYRNLSGMGGRASLTSNAWDPAQLSVAQQQYESGVQDIYRQFVQPPKSLSYLNKRERHKIHRAVYPRDTLVQHGGHLDLDSIESEATDLAQRDPNQAMRFYGNMIVIGSGAAFDILRWHGLAERDHVVPARTWITLGFDGSQVKDATALIATEVVTGYQWVIEIWERPAEALEWNVPIADVEDALAECFRKWQVWRMYGDPAYWERPMSEWAGRWGAERVVAVWNHQRRLLAQAVRAYANAINGGELHHDGNEVFATHVGNAVRRDTQMYDEDGARLYEITKERPDSPKKIDAAMAGLLSWQARLDALKVGIGQRRVTNEAAVRMEFA
jgi:hypothetical protein